MNGADQLKYSLAQCQGLWAFLVYKAALGGELTSLSGSHDEMKSKGIRPPVMVSHGEDSRGLVTGSKKPDA